MQTVSDIAEAILDREGGFVNDPDDPGGATNFGVTVHTMRRLGLDLDGDGDVDAADVRRLSKAQAREIFIRHYFHDPGLSGLPSVLHATVFDMQVNAGANAVTILQRLLGKMGFPTAIDGRVGPKTRGAARADRRVASRKYARRQDGGKGGWIRRAESFISPKYHLSDAEHAARTRGWA